jgi:hypothetical protein
VSLALVLVRDYAVISASLLSLATRFHRLVSRQPQFLPNCPLHRLRLWQIPSALPSGGSTTNRQQQISIALPDSHLIPGSSAVSQTKGLGHALVDNVTASTTWSIKSRATWVLRGIRLQSWIGAVRASAVSAGVCCLSTEITFVSTRTIAVVDGVDPPGGWFLECSLDLPAVFGTIPGACLQSGSLQSWVWFSFNRGDKVMLSTKNIKLRVPKNSTPLHWTIQNIGGYRQPSLPSKSTFKIKF